MFCAFQCDVSSGILVARYIECKHQVRTTYIHRMRMRMRMHMLAYFGTTFFRTINVPHVATHF